jgi:ABC-2 type transport system ATP-binding protein
VLAIEARGLEKRYGGRLGRRPLQALAGVDLRVERGTAFGFIGPNGAGKTTFVKALLGVVRPTGGGVRLLEGDPEDPRVRARVGYLPERLRLAPAWTPLDILESVARMKGLARTRAASLALLEEVGIADAVRRKVGTFSKGMKQRVGLAAALVGAPELLLLDEPTDGLDPPARAMVRELLARRLAAGTTLFLNSHLLSETERICDRIGVLVGGRVVREGRIEDLTAAPREWTARFAPGASADALAAAGFTGGADGAFRIAADGVEALDAALGRARRTGALLVELTREGKDLEAVLFEAMAPREEEAA